MTDTKLLSLLRVTETGSFTKAAESLSLTQPAISQHIRQLEQECDAKLFERSHNRLRLTREGEVMVFYARRILAMYERMEQALRTERDQVRALTVGITHSAESSAIIQALTEYARGWDDLSLKILTSTTDKMYAMLRSYELDFAFVENRVDDPFLEYVPVDTDSLILAVGPDHPLAKDSRVSVQTLKQERLILRLPNSNSRDLFTAALLSQNMSIEDFNVVLEIDNITTIKDLVRRNFGVTVLARSACREELASGSLCALEVEGLSMARQINIAAPRDFSHMDIIQGIVEKYESMKR